MNADICMQTHRESLATAIRWQAHTKTHTLWETSNSRAYISLKIHAANAGARACCFLDISLPKGLYFILPSNPMSPQFSHNHIPPTLLCPVSFLWNIWRHDWGFDHSAVERWNSWSISAPPSFSSIPVYYVQWSVLGSDLAIFLPTTPLVEFASLQQISYPHFTVDVFLTDRCLRTTFSCCLQEIEGAANLVSWPRQDTEVRELIEKDWAVSSPACRGCGVQRPIRECEQKLIRKRLFTKCSAEDETLWTGFSSMLQVQRRANRGLWKCWRGWWSLY